MLFLPDKYHTDKIKTSKSNHKRYYDLVQKYYDLGLKFENFQLIGETNINALNFKCSEFYIKIIPHAYNKKFVKGFPDIVGELKRINIPCSSFLANNKGAHITELETKTPLYICVQHFVHGAYYSGTLEQFEASLELLKKLRLFSLPSASYHRKSKFINYQPFKQYDFILQVIEKMQIFDEFDSIVLKNKNYITEILKIITPFLQKLNTSQVNKLRHQDLHPYNVIFSQSKLQALVDLESFNIERQEITEAFAIYKLGRKSIAKKLLTIEQFQHTCSKYGFQLSEYKKFVQLEIISRVLLILELHYLKNNTEWDTDLEQHLSALREIELMFV